MGSSVAEQQQADAAIHASCFALGTEEVLGTSACWSDANGDGWSDLLVTYEWGPIRLFLNQNGTLLDRSQEAGLEDLLGWWNGITAGDVDNDGDADYVATNFGLNTKYHARTRWY